MHLTLSRGEPGFASATAFQGPDHFSGKPIIHPYGRGLVGRIPVACVKTVTNNHPTLARKAGKGGAPGCTIQSGVAESCLIRFSTQLSPTNYLAQVVNRRCAAKEMVLAQAGRVDLPTSGA